jgi:hypothetical protein
MEALALRAAMFVLLVTGGSTLFAIPYWTLN